jgi:hypothetical protein
VILLEVFSQRLSVKFHPRLPFVVRHVSGIERRFVTDETQPWFVLGLRLAFFVISIRKDRIRHNKGNEVCGLLQSLPMEICNKLQNLLLVLDGPAVPLLKPQIDFDPEVDKAWPVRPSAVATR